MTAYETFADQYVSLKDGRVRYWSAGTEGTPILLVHALGASVEFWGRVIGTLAKKHRVFALDLPGFGLSDKPDVPYGEAYLAGAICAFLDALKLQRIHLIGNSMGGAVSLRFVREYPDRVDRLVLVCAGGLGRAISPKVRMLSIPIVGDLLAKPSPDMTRRLVQGAVVAPDSVPKSLLDASYEYSKSPGATRAFLRTLRNGIRYDGQRPETLAAHRRNFPHLKSPTLILWSDKDKILPTDYLETVKEIPNVRVHRFTNCGHYPQLEMPGEFCDVTLDFLDDAKTPQQSV